MVVLWNNIPNGVRVVRLSAPKEIEELVRLFEDVAQKEGWQPSGALRLWLERSVYFALELNGQLIGGLQMVRPDPMGMLPSQSLWPEVQIGSPGRCNHIAVLALQDAFRGQPLLFWRLVVEMWRYCVGEGLTTLLIEVTPRVLPLYQRLGWPLEIRGELRRHWGEDCYLCTLGIPEVAEALLRRMEQRGFDSADPYYLRVEAALQHTHTVMIWTFYATVKRGIGMLERKEK